MLRIPLSAPFLLAAGPPVEVVAVAASLLVVLVFRSGVEPISGVRELGFGEGHPAALAAVHSQLPVPDEFATAFGAVTRHLNQPSLFLFRG